MDCQWHANKISFLDSFCKKGTCGNIATSAFALLWPRSKQKMSVHNLNQLWTLDMVGVTGFEPAIALPSRIVAPTWQNQVASPRYTRLRPLLALWGKTSKKRPTGAFFLRFLLIPNRSLGTNKRPWVQIKPLQTKKRKAHPADTLFSFWSEWLDLNQRPLGPEPSALPNWATPR